MGVEQRMIDRDVTAVVVNYRTLELTRRSVETLRAHCPSLPLIVIDNGSGDASTAYVRDLASHDCNIRVQLNKRNLYHGPALDQALRLAPTQFVFTLDSDCQVVRSGFLEAMLAHFDDPQVYAVGELRYKNRFGYTYAYWDAEPRSRPAWIPYVHPYAMLVDRGKYLTLPAFVHHGTPCIKNMRAARDAGYVVRHFPVGEFVLHHAGGTSLKHGFGVRGRLRLTGGFYLGKLYDLAVGERALPVRYPSEEQKDSATP
jgi:glycosyltransferase involved in cell wall biosynthesis